MSSVSIIILTLNEEANIERCLQSVSAWANEIFVVDSGSTDRTVEIARQYTDKIVTHEFVNYAKQRNWAQANLPITNDWVLHLDAGETVRIELAEEIESRFQQDLSGIDGFLICRRVIFMGRWIRFGGLYPTYHLRLFRRDKGYCEEREYDQHYKVDGHVVKLQGDIEDDTAPNLHNFTVGHARWATSEVAEYFKQQESEQSLDGQVQPKLFGTAIQRRRWLRQNLYGRVPLFVRPISYFFVRYILLMGFRDGIEGLIYHTLQGFWYRFYVDAKIYEARKQNKAQIAPKLQVQQ